MRRGFFSFVITLLAFFFSVSEADASDEKSSESISHLSCDCLLRDLKIVDYWNRKAHDRLPVIYNNVMQVGYINMPSARMADEGTFAFGYSHVPPYRNYNMGLQLFSFLEVSGSYRIFNGVSDGDLGADFGDFSDKGANLKLGLLRPDGSDYNIPGIAIGIDDFIGSRNFTSEYVVCSQSLVDYNLEWSLGIGRKRIRGLFGGIAWTPWRQRRDGVLGGLTLIAEYDGVEYAKDPNPNGRSSKSSINYGISWRLWNSWNMTVSRIRGEEFSAAASVRYNFGNADSMLLKVDDVLPYRAPLNFHEIGIIRPHDVMAQEFAYAMKGQKLRLLEMRLSGKKGNGDKTLYLTISNETYYRESDVRKRIKSLLIALLPHNIVDVVVAVESSGMICQQYFFRSEDLQRYRTHAISDVELDILSPLRNGNFRNKSDFEVIYKDAKPLWRLALVPRTRFVFGSAQGKFKYSLGAALCLDGYIWNSIYYNAAFGKRAISTLDDVHDFDTLNPSQIINVRSDYINYEQQDGVMIDNAYLQKNWSMGSGWYSRIAGGHFEFEYGGIAGEALYYSVDKPWAIGFEIAGVRKRKPAGIGFETHIRKLDSGRKASFERFRGKQYFLSLYYDIVPLSSMIKIKAGKFLARDAGVRTEFVRYFKSGLMVSVWYTRTNAHDILNRSRYQDKGVGFEVPLDILSTQSSRKVWKASMSAWLRDVGAMASTGMPLYDILSNERR